jgi:Protein kinase domain
MDNSTQKTPDLKWERLARVGRGKAAVVWRVRNTVTKEVQLWKWTHSRGRDGSGETTVLEFLKGHDNIQKVLHWDDLSNVLVLEFANGGDMHTYTLDHFGSTRQTVPEMFIWHSLRSMAAALAYCQSGWKYGDPFVVKKGWRPIIHQDFVEGNILLHWHRSEPLPRLVLSDFGDATFLDKMPSLQYDYRLRMMRARDPTASHLKRDIHRLGSVLQSMLVVHMFGGNAEKMQQDHNVALAFEFVQAQSEPAFSQDLTQLVTKLVRDDFPDQSTEFMDALALAEELIPVANAKIAKLSKTAITLPGRPFDRLDNDDDDSSTTFHAPLPKDVSAFVRYYEGQDALVGGVGLKKKYRQGELDLQFAEYRDAHIGESPGNDEPFFTTPGDIETAHRPLKVRKPGDETTQESDIGRAKAQSPGDNGDYTSTKATVYRKERRLSLTGEMESSLRDIRDGTFVVKIEDTNEHGSFATAPPQDAMMEKPPALKSKIANSFLDNWLRGGTTGHKGESPSPLTGEMMEITPIGDLMD